MCEKSWIKVQGIVRMWGGAAGRMPLNKITHFLEALR